MAGVDQEQFRDLLNANHRFPGPYTITVIAVTDDDVASALRAVLEDGDGETIGDDAWTTRASSGGRYTSHHVTLECESADAVIELYARVRLVRGVVTVM